MKYVNNSLKIKSNLSNFLVQKSGGLLSEFLLFLNLQNFF